MNKRVFCAGAMLLLLGTRGEAQGWRPKHPVRLLVGTPPGSITDLVSRSLGKALEAELGQPVAVENRPGQGGLAAATALLAAQPDGETLLVSGPQVLMSTKIRESIVPVASLAVVPYAVVARKGITLASLRKKPKVSIYASGFYAPLIAGRLGLEGPQVVDLPNEAAALAGVLGGTIDAAVVSLAGTGDLLKNRDFEILGVVGKQAHPDLRALPSLTDIPPPLVSPFIGTFVPKGTPNAVILALSEHINHALKSAPLTESFTSLRLGAAPSTPEVFSSANAALLGIVADKCKVKDTCDKDAACPRPCPDN